MSDQHNIDNFFRNRFKDFEVAPDPEIWDKISERLDEKAAKEDKEGIVFLPWLYRAAGIAAAIALLFFIGNQVFDSNNSDINTDEQTTSTTKETSDKDTNGTTSDSQLTNTDNKVEQNTSQDKSNNSSEQELLNQEQIANEDSKNGNSNSVRNTKDSSQSQGNALQNGVAQQNTSNNTSQNAVNNGSNATLTNSNTTVANATNQNKTSDSKQKGTLNANNNQNSNNTFNTTQNAVAGNVKNGSKSNNNSNSNTKGSEVSSNIPFDKNATGIAQVTTQKNTNDTNATIDKSQNLDKTDIENVVAATEKKDKKKETIKKSLLDVINDLHDLENNKTEIEDVPFSRWTVSPNASPVYYNTFGNGSPIHETFGDNTKTGDVNLSYGVNVGYDVSKRLTVRAGVHRVDYSYSTEDIAVVPSIDGPQVTTIDFRTNDAGFDIQDRQVRTAAPFAQYQLPTTAESSIFQKQIEGDLNQRMSFIEVPLEVKYAVLDKKIGINVIGGMSTLLLTENSIILDSPLILTELGEATNLNDVSFSTNIGFGIDYKFSNQLEFNLEPMLKYQLNTFSRNTGNFNPYSIGVYTGVSFRF
ncbi:MAG: hypothetical protein AAF611_03415 [Bacteroidota bacterium]